MERRLTPGKYIKLALRTETSNYRFASTGEVTPRIEHGIMGIETEAGELLEAISKSKFEGKKLDRINVIEELGDLMWYQAILADELGISFENIWSASLNDPEKKPSRRNRLNPNDFISATLQGVGVTEQVSSASDQGLPDLQFEFRVIGIAIDAGKLTDAIKRSKIYGKDFDISNLVNILGSLMTHEANIISKVGTTFEEVWERNIAKLKARYPEKYTDTNALNRDLTKERRVLEN